MTRDQLSGVAGLVLLLALPVLSQAQIATAQDFSNEQIEFRKIAGNFSVYLAIMPSEMITGPDQTPEPGASPYQPTAAKDSHHVMVSIFEYPSGKRISKATVLARVAGLGFSGEKKVLNPMELAGATLFANSYPMIGRGPFRVDIQFQTSPKSRAEHATFYFTHPQFSIPGKR
ncbi:MAG: hypothetical protein AB7E73_05840 [Burkholderiales bacterium]